jgi:hypothetical protein
MKLSTFLLLLDGKAFFPSVATLQVADPLEGYPIIEAEWLMRRLQDVSGEKWTELCSWLHSNADEQGKADLKNAEKQTSPLFARDALSRAFTMIYARNLARRRAVWCWHQSAEESAAMWPLYANAGIAVRTSVAAMKEALHQCKRDLVVSRVRYTKRDTESRHSSWINPESTQDRELIYRPHLVKGIEYAHEQEVRVSAACHPEQRGLWVDNIEAVKLIEEVVISPSIPHDETEAILGLVKSRLERGSESGTIPKSADAGGGQEQGGNFRLLVEGQFKSGLIVRRSSLLGWRRDDDVEEAIFRNYCSRKGIQLREDLPPPLDAL